MIFPKSTKSNSTQPSQVNSVDAILKGQGTKHKGALMGIIANGGRVSIDGFILEVIAHEGDFRTIQIYECAKGIKPQVQTWQRTKTKVVKKEVYKKPKATTESVKAETTIGQQNLF